MFWKIGNQNEHGDAILDPLSHADDAAAAHLNAQLPVIFKCLKAILHCADGDDAAVKFLRRVDVMIVEVEPCPG